MHPTNAGRDKYREGRWVRDVMLRKEIAGTQLDGSAVTLQPTAPESRKDAGGARRNALACAIAVEPIPDELLGILCQSSGETAHISCSRRKSNSRLPRCPSPKVCHGDRVRIEPGNGRQRLPGSPLRLPTQ